MEFITRPPGDCQSVLMVTASVGRRKDEIAQVVGRLRLGCCEKVCVPLGEGP